MLSDDFALHYLLHSARLLDERVREVMERFGMRHRQARIIDALSRMEPTSQAALAREFNVTQASMSTMTARLIEAGYVSREIHPSEARSNVLRLTTHGRGMLAEIHAAWNAIDDVIADCLGAEDAETFARLARTLRDGLGGHVPGGHARGTQGSHHGVA